jgi:SAM-dependent methyltransferase
MTDHAKFTYESPQRIFRFSQLRRYATSARMVNPQPGESILEFGAGEGFLVGNLAGKHPATRFTLLEPFRRPIQAQPYLEKNVTWVKDITECANSIFDKLTCFEVLEHLTPPALDRFFEICRTRLRPGGTCIISMPIEVGPPALYKNVLRVAFGRPHEDTTIGNVLKCAFFLTERVERRPVDGEIPGHIGFDAFKTLSRIRQETDFILQKTVASPFEHLPWFVNNQLYFVFVRPDEAGRPS